MNIIRIVSASLPWIFAFNAFCIKNLSLSPYENGPTEVSGYGEKITDVFRTLSIPSSGGDREKCGASSSNASPIYSNSSSPICKYLARENAVDSNEGFYKKEEISVKFNSKKVNNQLQKSYGYYSNLTQRSETEAETLIKDTSEYINSFFEKPILNFDDKNGGETNRKVISVGDFFENRIKTGQNTWVSSEDSDEFVAKRIFGPAPYSRVSSILKEWERKFLSTVDHGTVKTVVERIKNIDVLSGLLAAAVCDEYEENLKNGKNCRIEGFVEDVYKKLEESLSGEQSDYILASRKGIIDRRISNKQTSDQNKKFDSWYQFNKNIMSDFWDNFKKGFLGQKDAIIKNTLTGLKLYKIGDTLKKRFDSIADVITPIEENNEIFAKSFGGRLILKDHGAPIDLAGVNVDLSLMEAISVVHWHYNVLLKRDQKQEIKLSSLYSRELINMLRTDEQASESLYASILASKIMETFLYQACYAQQACGQDVRGFLELVNKSLFACSEGLKLSSVNYVDKNGLKEVFYTKNDEEIIEAVDKSKETLGRAGDKTSVSGEKIPDDYVKFISKSTVDKVLKTRLSYVGEPNFKKRGDILSIFDCDVHAYNGVSGHVHCDAFGDVLVRNVFQGFLRVTGSHLLSVDTSNVVESKAYYDDVAIVKACNYALSGDEKKISGKSVEMKDSGFSIDGKIVSEQTGEIIQINGESLDDWQIFLIIREELKTTFAKCSYYDKSSNTRQELAGKDDDFWNKLTACIVAKYLIPNFEKSTKEKEMVKFFKKCKERYNTSLAPKKDEVKSLASEDGAGGKGAKESLIEIGKKLSAAVKEYNGKVNLYNNTMYDKEDLSGDGGNGINQSKLTAALRTYNSQGDESKYAVEDIYLSARLAWFLEQCEGVRCIISDIDKKGFGDAEKQIKDMYKAWTNLKWLSAHPASKRTGYAGAGISNTTSNGIGAYIERCLDVPVFSATKEWFSQTEKKLPEKLEDSHTDVGIVVDILSRMHKDICNFFVNRLAATFLCNIFEGNKDYSVLTEENKDTKSLILKSFSSSIIDLIADVYKMKESINENASKNIANSSDLLIYAKDCLLDSTTCNKGVVKKLDCELAYATSTYFERESEYIGAACLNMKCGKTWKTRPITPMISIDNINFSLKDGVDNKYYGDKEAGKEAGKEVKTEVVAFPDRNESAMHPLSFTALVDFIGGRMNFDQRMVLLDSIGIPIEGLFEEFQRVTKSGLLGESPLQIPFGEVLDKKGLGGVMNRQESNESLTIYDRFVYGITENPFFVNESDRNKYGAASGSVYTASTPLLYSLKDDSFGKTIAFSINDVVEKGIFSPKKIQVLLQLLVKSKDVGYIYQVSKPVFYYLSFSERELAYGVESVYSNGGEIPLGDSPTRNGIYLYKTPYFSPMYRVGGRQLRGRGHECYNILCEYTPFYLNIGDVYSRAVVEDDGARWNKSREGTDFGKSTVMQSGCFRNILGNVDFYDKKNQKTTGNSVKRLANRFCRGLFNLKIKDLSWEISLNRIIVDCGPSVDQFIKAYLLRNFVCKDLKHFSDILLLSGTADVIDSGNYDNALRINNSSVCMMNGMYAPFFCHNGYLIDEEGKDAPQLNNFGSYKGFFLPAAGMLLSDKMGSFMAENKFSDASKYLEESEQYVKSMFGGVIGSDKFQQYFNYGLWNQEFLLNGHWYMIDNSSKNSVLSANWNVRYTNSEGEKKGKIKDLLELQNENSFQTNNGDLFLFLADNEPKHIHKIAEKMLSGGDNTSFQYVTISTTTRNNKEEFEYLPVDAIDQNLLGDENTATKWGFFSIGKDVNRYIKERVLNILKMEGREQKNAEKISLKNQDTAIRLYAGLLYSLLTGEWKFKLGKILKK